MSRKEGVRKTLPIFLGIAAIAAIIGLFPNFDERDSNDTWNPQYDSMENLRTSGGGGGGGSSGYQSSSPYQSGRAMQLEETMMDGYASMTGSVSSEIGFAVGGAQDVDNFRANIENDFLPLHTDITYEGLFYDYYFDTAAAQECKKLFCPSYSSAVSRDPFSQKEEYFVSVGLNSGLTDFERKKLNLVIVLDVSGSMATSFDQYHYDQYGNPEKGEFDSRSKMQVAAESVAGLLDHLTDDDRLGIVLFDDEAHTARPLSSMDGADRGLLKENILDIYADGGTNMAAGIRMGTSLFDGARTDKSEYENRIIFLTDAMPNRDDTRQDGLLGMISRNAEKGIHSTVIGIGVDFNTELIDHITKARGANYYSVHSSSEFKERMVDEFEFMVTPLVFDLTLDMESEGYRIKEVYGSPESAQATGQIIKVNTLFPSKVYDGQTRGGIILVKLEKLTEDAEITLSTGYEDRSGHRDGDSVTVSFGGMHSTGLQKGVLLVRYAELMKTWAYGERSMLDDTPRLLDPYADSIHVPDYVNEPLGRWERQSVPLAVSEQYHIIISEFNDHFQEEMIKIGDFDLLQEVAIMQKLEKIA